MYDLRRFTLDDMYRCSAALRSLGAAAVDPDDAAQRIVSFLFEQLRVPEADVPACVLVRLFRTSSLSALPESAQAALFRTLGADAKPDTKCLTLRASRGARAEWNDPACSRAHRFIPLASPQAVATMPMVSGLIAQLGVPTAFFSKAPFVLETDDKLCNVFHVEQAPGSEFVPDQAGFVQPYGIRSVLGFGGLLPGHEVFATILFSSVPIPRETADLFRTIAPSVGLALLPHVREIVEHRVAATEELLRHHERIALAHHRDLRELAERLARSEAQAREEARRAEEAVRARDEFISIASHELRGPLAAILPLAELLQRQSGVPTALLPKLAAIARQARRMASLVNKLLDVTRIRAGRLELELALERFELGALVQEVIDDAVSAERPVHLHATEPVEGEWDRQRIAQVVENLLSNAVKYGAGRAVDIYVEGDGRDARLRVRDHGPGISPEFLPRLFEPFEREGSSRAAPGMGLGLYIVKGIVQAHRGTIRVESLPGDGTTFTVLIPRAMAT